MNMKALKSKIILSAALFFILSTFSCGMKHNIKGRVVDAETGDPIEGAAVAIHWYYYRLSHQIIGFTSGFKHIATYETLSDSNGNFETTKHLKGEYDLGVYKKGYVCWGDDYIFNPEGTNIKREDHQLESGMIIKLEPFKNHYDKFKHSKFVMKVDSIYYGPVFNRAIEDEVLLFYRTK